MATITSNATGGNWGDGTTWVGGVAPVSGDAVVIATTGTDKVTLDGVYPAVGAYAAITINSGAILEIPVGSNSGLIQTGDVLFTVTGTLRTAGSTAGDVKPLNAGVTCVFTMTPSTDGGAGYVFNGTVLISGAAKDHFVLLDADIGDWDTDGDAAYDLAPNVTVVTVASLPSGWKANDLLAIAPTGRTYSHWETCLLSGDAADVTLDVDGWNGTAPTYTSNDGVAGKPAWNHQGDGNPTQARAEIINLTRSFKIYSTDATKRTYIAIGATATAEIHYVEAYNASYEAAGKRGFNIATTTGTFISTGCVQHDGASRGFAQVGALTSGTVTVDKAIAWNMTLHAFLTTAWSGAGSCSITNSIAGKVGTTANYGFNLGDAGSLHSGCRAVGNIHRGITVPSESIAAIADHLKDVVSHSNGDTGVYIAYELSIDDAPLLDGAVVWRNTGGGIAYVGARGYTRIGSVTVFGNATGQFNGLSGWVVITAVNHLADAAYTETPTTYNLNFGDATIFGGSGNGTQMVCGKLRFNNMDWTSFSAPNFNYGPTVNKDYLLSFRHDQTEDDHRGYFKYGSILSEATVRHTTSGLSWRFIPSGGAGVWFRVATSCPFVFRAAVDADTAVTLKAWVKLHASYDGTAKPRIVALGGLLQGVASDVVGDSHSGSGDWEELTVALSGGNTPTESGIIEFVVEGQGTTGGFYVDDVSKA